MADAAPILYGPDGQPIKREILKQSIAGPSITGVRSPYTGYPGDGLNPIRLATILREADYGDPLRYLELAEQIEERDLHYAGVLATRKRSVSQLDITVDAASDDKDDIAKADMIREWLNRDELQTELFEILDAIGKAFSQTEIIWDTSMGQWRPERLEWRDPRYFRFDRNDATTPLLRTEHGDTPLPPFKFISAVIKAKSGIPIRSGIARLASWSWMFKAFTLRDWAIFTQTYGQPVRIGKYPSGATKDEQDTLFRAVANIAGDCAAIIPESMEIEFVESSNLGPGSDLYLKRADWLDQQVSKAVLGQTATTDAIAGGHAVGQEHREVQKDIEGSDAKVLSAILNRDLIRPWIDLEFGPQRKYPRMKIGREETEDLTMLSNNVARLVPLGLKVSKSWMNDKLGIPDPDPEDELLTAPVQSSPFSFAPSLNAAQPVRTFHSISELTTQTEQLCEPGVTALIDQVRGAVERSQNFKELQAELKLLKPGAAEREFASLIRMARVVANMYGRVDILDA